MKKRDVVLSLLDPEAEQEYVPAGFFIHFDPAYHYGQASVDKHLEYFHYTDMDLVKIQYERVFPILPNIQKPEDWDQMPLLTKEFFQPQVDAVAGLVKGCKDDALVIVTLYSPFMSANHASQGLLTEHLMQDPEKAKKGLEIATESLQIFIRECIKLGVDGFYASTQGGEVGRLDDKSLFLDYIKPYDLVLMEEIDQSCTFSVLHVCDYAGDYDSMAPYLDYPGQLINCNPHVGDRVYSGQEIADMFGRPFMGGLERKGIIATGSDVEIQAEVENVLRQAPDKFFLAADCTLPNDVSWDNIKTAITTAHNYKRI